MANLDPSIYNQAGRVNLGAGLSDILNQQRQRDMMNEQRQNSLASLAMQQQATQQKQKQQQGQDLNMWLAGAVQSGRPQDEIMQEAIAKGSEIGVAPEVTQRHVQSVFGAGATGQDRSKFAAGQAYPQELAKSLFAPDKAATLAQGQRGQIIFDNQGNAFNVNPYTNEVQPVTVGGKQIQGAQFAPNLQGQISGSKAAGKMQAETITKAQIDLPQDIQEAENTITMIDDLLAHPGFGQAVGKSSMLGIQKVPGTPAHDFSVRLDQLKGKQFLQAFQSLKGGGQITEVEGKKATDAISRMNNSQSEEEFRTAANEFKDVIRTGVENAKKKAGVQKVTPQTPASQDEGWSDL